MSILINGIIDQIELKKDPKDNTHFFLHIIIKEEKVVGETLIDMTLRLRLDDIIKILIELNKLKLSLT